jgi:nicotinate-nucleotide adenylyltransferase
VRLGLFGGRFDPPHIGHLLAAQGVLEALALDELWFVPAKAPPHKPTQAGAEDRYQMLVLATLTHPQLRVSRLELERRGVSYTFDTVTQVRAQYPHARLFFITGADAYAEIASWHRAAELVRLVDMVAIPRSGYTLSNVASPFKEAVYPLALRACDVSSTEIRTRLAQGRPVRYLVPELVETYLEKRALYR